jgi:hypothetical protein
VLDGARALDSGGGLEEGVAVDREGAGRAGGGDDRRRGTAERARELLDVGTGSGTAGCVLGDVVSKVMICGDSRSMLTSDSGLVSRTRGGSLDLGGANLGDDQVLRDGTADSVGGDVAGVALGRGVTDLSSVLVAVSLAYTEDIRFLTLPGAKVAVWRASWGSAPIAASCLATLSSICLLPEAADEAGSWCWVMAWISGLTAVWLHRLEARPTDAVFRSRARNMMALAWPLTSPAALALLKAWSATSCCRQSRF